MLIFYLTGIPFMVFAQEQAGNAANLTTNTIPEALRRPMNGVTPRYPRDMVIGELGQGTAPDAAWQFARNLISAIIAGSYDISGVNDLSLLEKIHAALESVSPENYHIGGGRIQEDGTVSFLVRFLGREKWMAGELYLLPAGNGWQLDDLILEEGRDSGGLTGAYQYDFTPYERFF